MKDIKFLVRDLVATRDLQRWINHRFNDPKKVIISKNVFDVIRSHGLLFNIDDNIHTITEVFSEYDFGDIREEDIVVDIGANIGAFSMVVARKAKHVYAIEPVFQEELLANIALNQLTNIGVIGCGISNDKNPQSIEFAGHMNTAPMMSFESLKKQIGHIDFIKIDCEGCEWSIAPESFKGIRRIEMEIHIRKAHKNEDNIALTALLKWFRMNGYVYTLIQNDIPLSSLTPFKRTVLLHVKREEE